MAGILLYQNRQDTENPTCRDCNLILISVDTLRADHMGVYGYKKNTTPNIDNLASNSFVFRNAYNTVPSTLPSFASLMTGLYPTSSLINDNLYLTDNQGKLAINSNAKKEQFKHETLAQLLSDNGYVTGAFVTNAQLSSETGISRGFKDYNVFLGPKEKETYEKFLGDSLNWLKKHKKNRFFLWIHLLDPHSPYKPPANLQCKFGHSSCNTLKTLSYDEIEKERSSINNCKDSFEISSKLKSTLEALYDGEIAYTDRLVQKILSEVDSLDLKKNTVLVFLADHGEGIDHKYYFDHAHVLYESSIKIPLIITIPANKKEVSIIEPVQNTDILPTLLDLLDIPKLGVSIDGKSFIDFLKGSFLSKTRPIFTVNTSWTKFSIIKGKYKYIYSPTGSCLMNGESEELYNLEMDPNEINNLALKEIAIVAKLKVALKSHFVNFLPKEATNTYEKAPTSEELLKSVKQLGY